MRILELVPAVDALCDFYRDCGRFDELKDELKYLAFHDEFLTSSVRANLADWRSGAQEELMRDFLQKVPGYRSKPYFRCSSRQHKLLAWLLLHRMRGCVHIIMKLNDLRKQKQY